MNILDCKTYRRFGVELELNTPNGIVKKLSKEEAPEGAESIAYLINKTINAPVEIHGWHATHNNKSWIIKPDSSCGIEVCTPILKGYYDLLDLLHVIDIFKKENISSDHRCSLHVHINVSDLTESQLHRILIHWIKCEPVFFDLFPNCRKRNRYCQLIGLYNYFEHDYIPSFNELVTILAMKYFSINTHHYKKGSRKTIEFRLGESNLCLDAFSAKNWILLLLHFIEVVKDKPLRSYSRNDPTSGLLWLDPKEMFKLLGFNNKLSLGLNDVKKWMLGRLSVYGFDTQLSGIWSNEGRRIAYSEIQDLLKKDKQEVAFYCPDNVEEHTYNKEYCI